MTITLDDRLFTQKDLADLLDIDPPRISYYIKSGRIPAPTHQRDGVRCYYTLEEVEEIVAKAKVYVDWKGVRKASTRKKECAK